MKVYISNMTLLSRICFYLKIIKFEKECHNGLYIKQVFKFRYWNPLTWALVFAIMVFVLIAAIMDALEKTYKGVVDLLKNGVTVESIIAKKDKI